MFLQTFAVIVWLLSATGWLLTLREKVGLATYPHSVWILAAMVVLASLLALWKRPVLRRVGAFGPMLCLAGPAAQLLSPIDNPLWFVVAVSAWAVPLLPLTDAKRDRLHLVAAAACLFAAPLFAGKLALWGPVHLVPQEVPQMLAQAGAWLAAMLVAHKSIQELSSPKGRLEANPGGRGGLAVDPGSLAGQIPVAGRATESRVAPHPGSSSALAKPPQSQSAAPDPVASGIVPRKSIPGWEDQSTFTSDEPDPNSSQILSRSILTEHDEMARSEMTRLLGPVVHLMHKVFRSYSALGFLADGASGQLVLNAKFGKGNVLADARIVPGARLLGNSIRSGLLTGDVANYGDSPEYYPEGERVLSLMALPVRNEESGDLQALLVVDHKSPRAFTDEHYQYFKRFAGIASALVTVQSARTAIERQATITNTFYDIQSRLTRHLKTEDLLQVLDSALKGLFPLERVSICMWNPQRQMAQIQSISSGSIPGPEVGTYFDLTDSRSVVGGVFRSGREALVRSFPNANRSLFEGRLDAEYAWKPAEVVAAPFLNDERQSFGVLTLESASTGAYSELDAKLLAAIAAIAAGALTRARMYQEMERLATIDGLTQVPNHRHFQTLLNQQIDVATRYQRQIGLLLFDIDHFKQFNDTYGHAVGDLVLKEVARTVQGAIRSSDMLARYGGEEFVVLIPQTDSVGAMQSGERVRSAVEGMKVVHEGKPLHVTISIGVCLYPDMASAKQDFIDGADKAMYYSKKTGRNRVTLYGPEAEALAREKEAVGGSH